MKQKVICLLICVMLLACGCSNQPVSSEDSVTGTSENVLSEESVADTSENGSAYVFVGDYQPGQENAVGNTFPNLQNGGFAASQGDWVYFIEGTELLKTKDFVTYEYIGWTYGEAKYLNVIGDWLYYLEGSNTITRVLTNGTVFETVATGVCDTAFLVTDDYIIYLDERAVSATQTQRYINLLGIDEEGNIVTPGASHPVSSDCTLCGFDNDRIYFRTREASSWDLNYVDVVNGSLSDIGTAISGYAEISDSMGLSLCHNGNLYSGYGFPVERFSIYDMTTGSKNYEMQISMFGEYKVSHKVRNFFQDKYLIFNHDGTSIQMFRINEDGLLTDGTPLVVVEDPSSGICVIEDKIIYKYENELYCMTCQDITQDPPVWQWSKIGY